MSAPGEVRGRPVRIRASELAGERDVLLASIEDLEREHAAGDLDDADYLALRADYVARAAAALRALEAFEAETGGAGEVAGHGAPGAPGARPAAGRTARVRRFLGRRRSRVVLGLVGALCALGLVAIAAAHLAGVRLPGQESSGSIQLPKATTVRQQLQQASVLGSTGKVSAAVALYTKVLAEVPNQPEALAYRGWLVRLAGIADKSTAAVRSGDAALAKAVRVAPRYADARALYGMALLKDDGRVHAALAEFEAFLADHPSHQLLDLLGTDMAVAFASAHRPVPAALRPYEAAAKAAARKAAASKGGAGRRSGPPSRGPGG